MGPTADSHEAKHLASLLGMDAEKIYTDESNTLEEMAKTILSSGEHYHDTPPPPKFEERMHQFELEHQHLVNLQ